MDSTVFLDTNVILRHILAGHADHSPRATAFFKRIERGETRVRTTDTVVFESVFALEELYRVPRAAVAEALSIVLAFPGVELPGKGLYRDTFDLYTARRGRSFAGCYHATVTVRPGLSNIFGFDRGFNNLTGITRRER